MRLRSLIFLALLIVGIVPTVLFLAIPNTGAYDKEVRDVEERHLLIARNIGLALERYQADVKNALRVLAANMIEGVEPVATTKFLDDLRFRHICIATMTSSEVLFALNEEIAPCPDRVPEPRHRLFRDIARAAAVTFTPVMAGPDGQPRLYMTWRNDEFLAVGAIDTSYIVELGTAISFGDKGHAAIVDHTGRVIAHPLADWRREMKDISGVSAVQRMLAGESGVETFYSPAMKADMIAGYTSVKGANWGVMIPQPLSELKLRARDSQRLAIGGVGSAVLLAVLLSWLISGYLTRPVQRVVDAAKKFSEGERSARAPEGGAVEPEELRLLRSTFNDMADSVVEMYERLAAIAESMAKVRGDHTYEKLIGELARVLGVDYAIFAEIDQRDSRTVRTNVVFVDGELAENFSYALTDSPCRHVFDGGPLVVGSGVREKYPDIKMLREWGIESYAGLPVNTPDDVPIGLICLFNRKPMKSINSAVSLMRMTADRISTEWQRRRLEDDLRDAIRSSDQANQAKTDFLAHMSHELRTPLNGIIGFSQVLGNPSIAGLPDEKRIEYANDIAASGRHLLDLINDILDLSKIEAGELTLHESQLDLESVLDEAVRIAEGTGAGKSVSIESRIAHLPYLVADRRLIKQVILNILSNAVKFSAVGSVVRIAADVSVDGGIVVTVDDRGIGIAREDIPHVLEPFGQANADPQMSRDGTGLGLTISNQFMTLHAGRLDIESELGEGTTVTLSFPAFRSVARATDDGLANGVGHSPGLA